MSIPPLTVPELLEARAKSHPDHAPLRVDGQAPLTYGEWARRARAVAHGLFRTGAGPGQRIALLFDGLDWVGYATAYLAVLQTGGTAIHLNAHIPAAEMQRRIDQCGVHRMIHSPFLTPPPSFRGRADTVSNLDSKELGDMPVTVTQHMVADIRYTSGTTGLPKGYLVTHGNLTYGRTLQSMGELSASRAMLVPMTLGSSTGATVLTVALTAQAPLVLCSPLLVERMGVLIEDHQVESLMLTPHIGAQLVEERVAERYDLSSVKLVASASAPMPPPLAEALLGTCPSAKLQIACAQSEASPALLVHTYTPERPFSVGKPTPITELRIVDTDGADVAPGEVGEIWLRTGAPKRLFIDSPEVNAELLADGWHRTKDLGRLVEGEVELFDRQADALTRDGRPVSSIALEAQLLRHPAVREAAVVGSPIDASNSEITAVVSLRAPGALPELERDVVGRPDTLIDRFVKVAALPRTHNGKVLKRLLRLDVASPRLV